MGRRGRKKKLKDFAGYDDDLWYGRNYDSYHDERRHGKVVTVPSKETDAPSAGGRWHTGTDAEDLCAKDCSWAEKNQMKECVILLSEKAGAAISYLIKKVRVEWQLLLCGTVEDTPEREVVHIVDYFIPKQVVGAAHVTNLDCVDRKTIAEKGIVATIHSHSTMESFFSGTDIRECNSSPIVYHAVINNRYEYQAVKQRKLACGMFRFEKIKLEFAGAELPKPDGFENITVSEHAKEGATWNSVDAGGACI